MSKLETAGLAQNNWEVGCKSEEDGPGINPNSKLGQGLQLKL